MIIGILGSKILLMIVLKLLGIHTSVSITFSFQLDCKHSLYLSCYILIIIQASIYLSKSSIKSLMASQDSKEDSHITLTLGEVILGVLGIVLILTGYYLSTRFVEIVDDVILPFVILILTVLGTYFSFEVRFLSF